MAEERTTVVGVVISNCNYGRYLAEVIDSALNQGYIQCADVNGRRIDRKIAYRQSPYAFGKLLSLFKPRDKNSAKASGLNMASACKRCLPRRYELPATKRLMGIRPFDNSATAPTQIGS